MSATTSTRPDRAESARRADAAPPSFVALVLLYAKYTIVETIRIPIAVLGNLIFPTLAMFFFVVPQEEVTADPVWS